MPKLILDCKGLPCPQPVLQCKTCIEEDAPDSLEILVDNEAAKQNVSRFLQTKQYAVTDIVEEDNAWRIQASNTGAAAQDAPQEPATSATSATLEEINSQTLVFISSDCMGRGDDELGGKLMINFLSTLPELGDELWRIILVNGGVKLAVTGSPALDLLKKLAANGVSILVCGTCLDHFGILDQKEVGETTNMLDVVTSLQMASKVIRP